MADTKISALTALAAGSVDAAADLLPIVDTSVTTTKKITVTDLMTAFHTTPTLTGTVTLSGTTTNIATGSNYISNGGTDAGLSFDASNNATFSAGVALSGTLTLSGTAANIAIGANFISYAGTDAGIAIDSNNKVGLGTAAPQSLLDIQGPAGVGAAAAGILTLATKELTVVDDDQLGRINFNAPLESSGTDAILSGAAIWAEAEATFDATTNSTAIVFGTATTSAAIERMRIDSSGNVGIGTTSPGFPLEVKANGSYLGLNCVTAAGYSLVRGLDNGTERWAIGQSNFGGADGLAFYTGASVTERGRVTGVGNLKWAGTATRATTEGTNHIDIFDGTAPVGTLANGISLYSTSGELRVMDAAGNATLLSPHDRLTNEWIFDSVDTVSGKRLRIDVEKILRFIDQKYGLNAILEEMT